MGQYFFARWRLLSVVVCNAAGGQVRLDHCNALLYAITDNLYRRLQSIQNAAARLLTGTKRRDHISPVLSRLHWLPVKQRVVFKLAIIVFQSLRGETP